MNNELKPIIKKISRTHVLHRYHIHKAASNANLYPGQMPVLECILQNENCTQKELATLLQVSAPCAATSVKRLIRSGLIKKTVDSADRRAVRLCATEQGKQFADYIDKAFLQIDKTMFSGFSQEEISQFSEYLDRLCANLNTDETSKKKTFELFAETADHHHKGGKHNV